MNNLDFSAEPLFSWYVVLLALSGLIMVVLGAVAGGLKVGMRILNIVAGLAFLGYGYYLAFVFEGGSYRIFFQAFILPVAMIASSVKALVERGNAKQQPAPQAAAFDPNAPQAGAPVAPQAAAPYQPGVPPQPVADNPYAQPAPAAQPGQPQPPQHPAG
ncbi:hypothetical protein ACFQ6N_22805 [Kitasatospora sp. NPDC056446]|uniref:hypothetical protein n=1 Tax=Kitasatospora sp. NPDC056446 TaxID=3345819 RepID=UPI0036C4322E